MSLGPLVDPVDALPADERERTARHVTLPQVGDIGQRRLAAAHVAVMGAGGLGAPLVLALASAGIGTLTIIDDDRVELSNLHRQVIHRLQDVGALKVDSAVRVAADLSPTRVVPVARRLDGENAERLLAGADVVIDGSDRFATRALVASACERLGVPLVWGTVQAFDAQVTVLWSAPPAGHDAIVLADLHPPESVGQVPSCAEVGVMGALVMQVGSLMALEAIKLITGIGDSLLGRVLVIDGLRARQLEVPLRPARAAAVAAPPPVAEVDAGALDGAWVLDVREGDEVRAGMIPGAHHVPLAEVLAAPAAAVAAADAPIVVVCRAGGRAQRAAQSLAAVGIESAVLAGGMLAWDARAADAGHAEARRAESRRVAAHAAAAHIEVDA